MRISKAPEERKQEILDTAMRLFSIKGYNETTMADIAKEMNVVKGLCYRYFDSKQKLFEEAMDQYVIQCSEVFLNLINDHSKPLSERLDLLGSLMIETDKKSKYNSFFHKDGNEEFHERLTIKMCRYLSSYFKEEIERLCECGEIKVNNPEVLVNFIMYGQVGLLSSTDKNIEEVVRELRHYIDILIKG
ncbi:TetR/AcrR family transcriptional regulator [uncultured Anaerofustis sp.]|uniref:TetR/AcrR family transcriptional regulator n=1 Tax=uncultured Anaerofustis sp. TaxID=904996 RepID=UPI0025EC9A61|nr:TetR/AcrR family transcriptional regulator [uncultured Anaerofustis sp.]